MKRLITIFWYSLLVYSLHAQLVPGNTYRIVPVSEQSKSLFVKDASRSANADVQLWTETNVPAQQWTLIVSGTNYIFRNVYTGMYLGLSGTNRGATTRQLAATTSSRWKLEAVDEAAGIYKLKPSFGTSYLAAANPADGNMPALAAKTDTPEQQWIFKEVEAKTEFNTVLREDAMDSFIAAFVTRHGSYRSFGSGGWGNAEMLEVGLDAYETTGLQKYIDLCKTDYQWFSQNAGSNWDHLVWKDEYKWFGHDFNDDVMWEIIAVARMAWLTGEKIYLTAAKRNFDIIYKRAYMPQWGMMRWAEDSGDDNGTNSCIMGPTEVAACYLAMAGAGEEYFEKARDLYAKQRQYLANMQTGQVYDSFVWDPNTGKVARDENGKERRNNWASTYNQGTMLGAAVLLYNHYGTKQYATDADKIMDYTVRNLCNSDGIISVCQVNDGDLCGFKGILMRYVRRYVLDLNRPKYQQWLTNNAFRAYNNRDKRGVTTSAWLTKSKDEDTNSAFSCSCAASAAVNTVLGNVEKDAYAPLPATDFDYQSGLFVVAATDKSPALSIKNNTWVAYDNIAFGTTPVQSIALSIGRYPYTGNATVSIYLDKMEGDPLATLDITRDNVESTVVADIPPTVGTHHVYLKFAYSITARTNAFQLRTLQFSTQTSQEFADGIEEIDNKEIANYNWISGKYFDLSGRQVNPGRQKGLYIVNGKKVIR